VTVSPRAPDGKFTYQTPAGQSPAGQRLETRSRHRPKGTRDTSDDPDPPDRRAANSTPTTLTS